MVAGRSWRRGSGCLKSVYGMVGSAHPTLLLKNSKGENSSIKLGSYEENEQSFKDLLLSIFWQFLQYSSDAVG